MAQFEYEKTLDMLMIPEVVSALGDIRELKGKTASLSALNPETFSALVGVAKIQSTGASNRIDDKPQNLMVLPILFSVALQQYILPKGLSRLKKLSSIIVIMHVLLRKDLKGRALGSLVQ